ncbi:MAG: DNA-protecting protein DprA [Anaerolineales bacterium]|nr:DNA-protecting protein DprA [Anaerolineales bacterium]
MDRRYWIAFNLVRGVGPVKFRRLLDHFGDARAAWTAPVAALAAAGLDRRTIENQVAVRDGGRLDQALRQIDAAGVQVLTWEDASYPRNLLNIAQPPPVLYVKGTLAPADEWAVAIVGTRHCSAYGREAARDLATGLAANGVTVVSGLARGIDVVAHRAALEAGGRSLAVLGSGLDQVYPPEHSRLADSLAQAGAVVSDYALGTAPEGVNFPPRNRIISGLSKGVVVVEAGDSSGALITADFAAEQGRDVFAVPGSIFQRSARGTNKLIQQGAKLVRQAGDILEELNLALVNEQRAARTALPADATEQRLLACLSAEPTHIDELGTQVGLPIAQVSGALALLELKGLVRQVGGMNYVVAKELRAGYTVD